MDAGRKDQGLRFKAWVKEAASAPPFSCDLALRMVLTLGADKGGGSRVVGGTAKLKGDIRFSGDTCRCHLSSIFWGDTMIPIIE